MNYYNCNNYYKEKRLNEELKAIFDTLNYHNCGLLYRKEKEVMNFLEESYNSKDFYSTYNSPYWYYIMNVKGLTKERIYGKFMIFSYNPEEIEDNLIKIIENGLSSLIKYSTDKPNFQTRRDKNGNLSKSKIICIYTDRDYEKISDLAFFIKKNKMIRKDIPFQASYEYKDYKTNKIIKKEMMLSDFLL